MIFWDIETGPLPDDDLLTILPPFTPPQHPGEFDPASIKVGNLGEVKAAYKIQCARDEHTLAVQTYERDVENARLEHFAKFKQSAALSPITGRVLVIGLKGKKTILLGSSGESEPEILTQFWSVFCSRDDAMPGWNIHQFDLPFIIRRSWKLGVSAPSGVRDAFGRYWDARWVDLMVRYMMGQRDNGGYAKLNTAAKFLGAGEKPDGITGEDFNQYWFGTPADRRIAIEYLTNDLEMTARVAGMMGVGK